MARKTSGRKTQIVVSVEATTALFLTARHGRKEVLRHYLRIVPYGNRVRGIAFAARMYFDKPVADLSWAETAFLAAIQVDPGYREVNLTFDVHGAPPYASSERDENDGFRIGWNNGPALTKFSPTQLTMTKSGSD